MTRKEYEGMSAAQLKDLAKERGIKGLSAMRKADVINALAELDSASAAKEEKSAAKSPSKQAGKGTGKSAEKSAGKSAEKSTDKNSRKKSEKNAEKGTGRSGEKNSDEKVKKPARKQPSGAGTPRQEARPAQTEAKAEDRVRTSPGNETHAQTAPRTAPGNETHAQAAPRPAAHQETAQDPTAQAAQRRRLPSDQNKAQPQGRRPEGGQRSVVRPATPMTRGELRQSNPQPRMNERAESLQDRVEGDRPPMELKQLDSGNTVSGVLEVMADGYGFIRSNNYLPGEDDIYVSPSQIRRFNLKTGDIICGNTRVHAQQEKFSALLFVKTINGYVPSEAAKRFNFDEMTPVFPNERLRMERTGREIAMRIVDILSPIGKGQRGLIVSPPKAGKTTLLKDIARSIQRNNPEMHIIIMLIDERPEEVTDIREAIVGENVEVLDSTFDETPEHHKRVAEMGIERARRLVEHKRDVVILLDSITRLARAYNLIVPPSGRTLSGGLDPAALHPPKRFFGAARNMREGGSLTILATALVDTGSKMDDVVYEEFKGTGNMELILDRKLSERRVFPAIDIMKSGTRREDLLLTTDEGEASYVMRRAMNGMKGEDAVERILDMFARTRSNEELVQRIKHSHII